MPDQCEHECKYQLRQTLTYRRFVCSGCSTSISIADAEEILNEYVTLKAATERLIAEDVVANIAQIEACEFECQGGPIELNTGYIRLRDALRAYADILEGKDETRS